MFMEKTTAPSLAGYHSILGDLSPALSASELTYQDRQRLFETQPNQLIRPIPCPFRSVSAIREEQRKGRFSRIESGHHRRRKHDMDEMCKTYNEEGVRNGDYVMVGVGHAKRATASQQSIRLRFSGVQEG